MVDRILRLAPNLLTELAHRLGLRHSSTCSRQTEPAVPVFGHVLPRECLPSQRPQSGRFHGQAFSIGSKVETEPRRS
eukprot:1308182-Alexandrium_andersonii.AAC.1